MENGQWLRVNQAAEHASVGVRTLRSWFDDGLPSYLLRGVVLISRAELDRYIRKGKRSGLGVSVSRR